MSKYAPIVLFVFARPEHTRRTLEALAANRLADQSDLIIYADGARHDGEAEQVNAVRTLARSVTGFRSLAVNFREKNYGLAMNIIAGVTEVCARYGRVIVVEDDMVTAPCFLAYMNDALVRFAEDVRIASIHGYVYPVRQALPEAFFLRGADCWGWATWSRAWQHFNPDGQHLLSEIKRRKLVQEFDFHGAYPFSRMLAAQVHGKNDSWAIRWHASAFLAGLLTLYPGHSLVRNIGVDRSGIHCGGSDRYGTELCEVPPNLEGVEVRPSHEAWSVFETFFRQTHGVGFARFSHGFKRLLPRMTL